VRAVPTNAELKMVRALEVFNASDHVRTVGGVARSLGAPAVSVRPLADRPSVVAITVMWELSWYRFEVDLSDEGSGVRREGHGAELAELPPEEQAVNAAADERGGCTWRRPPDSTDDRVRHRRTWGTIVVVIFCVVPEPLADELYGRLNGYYESDPNVTVIVDRRRSSRREQGAKGGGQREVRDRRRPARGRRVPPDQRHDQRPLALDCAACRSSSTWTAAPAATPGPPPPPRSCPPPTGGCSTKPP
jgi:hypothetical protein